MTNEKTTDDRYAARVADVSAEGSIPASEADDSRGFVLDRKTLLPGLVILALIVVPVLVWAATGGGGSNQLRIDQGVNIYG